MKCALGYTLQNAKYPTVEEHCLMGEFLGGPVVRTPCFHCRGQGINPTSRAMWPNERSIKRMEDVDGNVKWYKSSVILALHIKRLKKENKFQLRDSTSRTVSLGNN